MKNQNVIGALQTDDFNEQQFQIPNIFYKFIIMSQKIFFCPNARIFFFSHLLGMVNMHYSICSTACLYCIEKNSPKMMTLQVIAYRLYLNIKGYLKSQQSAAYYWHSISAWGTCSICCVHCAYLTIFQSWTTDSFFCDSDIR